MSVTTLLQRRKDSGLSRERVTRQLDPPISAKTLERWEKGESAVPGWREAQLLNVYAKAKNGVAA